MKKIAVATVAGFLGGMALAAEGAAVALPRSTPEEQGLSSTAILAFVQAADQKIDAMHSFMLLRHGRVVAEGWWSPYAADTRHTLFSLTKSFTATAVGMAVAEGRMTIDDRVLPYFPDDAPAEPSDNLKAMRVRDLLTMSTGHHAEASLGPDDVWTRAFLQNPVAHKPGTFFLYNTPGTYMLSAIVQKATGTPVADYLRPRLFEPLGIDPAWATSPQGITIGGYGMSARTEDIARFGQLFLQKGEWEGRRLLPAAWVEAASSRQVSNGSNPDSDWEQGYGYQMWRCRNGCYRGDGAFGQYCVVMPDKDAVLVITSGVRDMQAVLNLVWEHLLPAMQAGPVKVDGPGEKKLKGVLAGLGLAPLGAGGGPAAGSGRPSGKTYLFPVNDQRLEAVALEGGESGDATLVTRVAGVEQRIACGRGAWRKGRLSDTAFAHGVPADQPIAASGTWRDGDTYEAKILFYETPFAQTLRLRFAGDQVFYDAESNVAFGPTKLPQLIGRAR